MRIALVVSFRRALALDFATSAQQAATSPALGAHFARSVASILRKRRGRARCLRPSIFWPPCLARARRGIRCMQAQLTNHPILRSPYVPLGAMFPSPTKHGSAPSALLANSSQLLAVGTGAIPCTTSSFLRRLCQRQCLRALQLIRTAALQATTREVPHTYRAGPALAAVGPGLLCTSVVSCAMRARLACLRKC